MAYSVTNPKGVVYYLNSKEVKLRGGQVQKIYYFTRDVREETAVDDLPEGMEVKINERNGFIVLRRKK